MDMKTFLQNSTAEEREKLASDMESSVGYFWLLAGGHRQPSPKFAKKLVQVDSRFTLPELRPDIWETAA